MDINEAKISVIEAGKKLVENGLIQRTWGNVSCRIDAQRFCITPSGREYMGLTPDEIVVVNICDLSYDGDIKPSSEKGIHAMCYALRPDVDFVIHTHQTYASLQALSGLDINTVPEKSVALIGTDIPLAAYGLPGTGKLREGVVDALKRSSSNAVLMPHHGAVCLGRDMSNAFDVANELENVCKKLVFDRYASLTGKAADSFKSLADYISGTLMRETSVLPEVEAFSSVRDGCAIEMTPADGGEHVLIDLETAKPFDPSQTYPDTAILHSEIYKNRSDVNAIIHTKEDAALAVSKVGKTVKPFLDDFAQIAGITLKNSPFDANNTLETAKKTVKKLKRRDAVLLRNNGAVCVGSDTDDAKAVELVTEKGCKAYLAANMYNQGKSSIKAVECILMRVIYKKKYSKQAK